MAERKNAYWREENEVDGLPSVGFCADYDPMTRPRPPRIHHCTSEPYRFFGRDAELVQLDLALAGGEPSLIALVGPGGQGKTAIVQHWLERIASVGLDGLFFWSFYRGKDADFCLRQLYGYAEGMDAIPDVAASYCVDRLLPRLRRERWALVLDGTEVAQHDTGAWHGRFLHPELGRLLEELGSEPLPGVVVLTTRFGLPTLAKRRHARILGLTSLDSASARGLLRSLGVAGHDAILDEVAAAGGWHAKAVELLGTLVTRSGDSSGKPPDVAGILAQMGNNSPLGADASDEERCVARVLSAYQAALSREEQDVLALATAFRDPPTEARLIEYLRSAPVQALLFQTWQRPYPRTALAADAVKATVESLVASRLLERVGRGTLEGPVIDAHPLVRRAFDAVLGGTGQRENAGARAGFLRGRPDRRRPATLEEAREEVELFHAYCDAGLWNEADSTYVALDNPKHRFLAPAFERDLLLRFFPAGDWRQKPLWPGFGRHRSLAICFELLGRFTDALAAYPPGDAPLRGDALLARGRLQPFLELAQVPQPWQALWQAYRAHALCLAGHVPEALALARSLVPVDMYEWVHVFECLLRSNQLTAIDLRSVVFRPPDSTEHRWADLARQRIRLDFLRMTTRDDLDSEYRALLEAYDRGGLPYERALTRLSHACWLRQRGEDEAARAVAAAARSLATQYDMRIVEADACALLDDSAEASLREETGYRGPARP